MTDAATGMFARAGNATWHVADPARRDETRDRTAGSCDEIRFRYVAFTTDEYAELQPWAAGLPGTLVEAARLLKRGGALAIETGNLAFGMGDSAPAIRAVLERLGFRDISVTVTDHTSITAIHGG
jgi:hypothetical protein